MNRRKRTIVIGLLLLLVLLTGGCGLWVHAQRRQYALNRQLIEALVTNDGKQALTLVEAGADPNTRYKPTPLPSLPELAKQLFHRSPPSVNDSPTAFLIACGERVSTDNGKVRFGLDDAPLMQAMLKHGANVNARSSLSKGGLTALMWAVSPQRQNTMRVLLQYGADVNAKDDNGFTPLMYSTQDTPSVTRLLLEHGANVNAKNDFGQTPLMVAVICCVSPSDTLEVIHLLLEHGSDVNVKDDNGQTPLVYIQNDADVRPMPPVDYRKIVALLRQYGAK